jgi:hypothetical protein
MKNKEKSQKEILSVVSREIHNASGYIGGELVARRKKSLEYYLGEPLGNEQEGRSQVVSNDVLDTVESLMPSLMRIFTSGDNVFNCEGMGPEDEEMARQCSDYLNYIFYKENDGFLSFIYSIQRCINSKEWNLKSILG